MITQINSSSSFLFNYGSASNSSQTNKWTQPELTADGILGGNSFAVSAPYYSNCYTWYAFQSNTTSYSYSWYYNANQADYIFYNPIPLKVTNINVRNRASLNSGGLIKTVKVYGSNDNSSWTFLTTYTSSQTSAGSTFDVSLNNNTSFFKYYKLNVASVTNSNAVSIQNLTLTAYYTTISIGNITFPMTHSNTNYSYALTYYGGEIGGSYVNSITATGMSLQNNSSATKIKYMTIGY